MSKASPKKVRAIMKRIVFHCRHLQAALNEAHNLNIISYDPILYKEAAPCASMWELQQRVEATTEKALANTMRREIESQVKWPTR